MLAKASTVISNATLGNFKLRIMNGDNWVPDGTPNPAWVDFPTNLNYAGTVYTIARATT